MTDPTLGSEKYPLMSAQPPGAFHQRPHGFQAAKSAWVSYMRIGGNMLQIP